MLPFILNFLTILFRLRGPALKASGWIEWSTGLQHNFEFGWIQPKPHAVDASPNASPYIFQTSLGKHIRSTFLLSAATILQTHKRFSSQLHFLEPSPTALAQHLSVGSSLEWSKRAWLVAFTNCPLAAAFFSRLCRNIDSMWRHKTMVAQGSRRPNAREQLALFVKGLPVSHSTNKLDIWTRWPVDAIHSPYLLNKQLNFCQLQSWILSEWAFYQVR